MKKIVVATDFSEASIHAAQYAVQMAKAIGASVHLLHSFQVPVVYSEVPVASNTEAIEAKARGELLELKTRLLREQHEDGVIFTELRMGSFYVELLQYCNEQKPYLVVMGSQGTTATQRFLFGGHAVHAMQHLPWPLITVPMGTRFHAIHQIGLACDYHKVIKETPVTAIKNICADFMADLHVLHTGTKEKVDPEIVFESGMLQEMLATLAPTYHFIENKNIDEALIDFAAKQHLDLLIVVPKHHDIFDLLMNRSHTKQLVLHSQVPVLALHG